MDISFHMVNYHQEIKFLGRGEEHVFWTRQNDIY